MTIHVVWEPLAEGCSRGPWDQAILESLFAPRWRAPGWPEVVHHDSLATIPEGEGAVVVLPARHHASIPDVRRLNGLLSPIPWVLLILNGDEEHAYPFASVQHPNLRLWVQTPDPDRAYPPGTRFLVNGPAPAAYEQPWGERTRDVVLLAQDTHERRHECADAVQALLDAGRTGRLERTAGFTQGLDPGEYAALMASAKVCPAPSGPVCVDSFRAWEAMELGAVPVLDDMTPTGWGGGYWDHLGASISPIPTTPVWDAAVLGMFAEGICRTWPKVASRAAAWWMRYQRELAHHLLADVAELSGQQIHLSAPDDLITVLVPTSPIPSHPSTAILEETVDSIRTQLPHAEILILCDGPNPSVEQYRQAYEDYLYEVARLCREKWANVLPIIHGSHQHQSGMLRHALDGIVTTPLLLWVEHDCPIRGRIDWPALVRAIEHDDARIIRLHHEARILDDHRHLMLGDTKDCHGAPLAPTIQYSARPHLAVTELYRTALQDHFDGLHCMLEDKLHSVLQTTPWDDWRLWIYTPADDEEGHGIRRSWHTDGRQGDEKWIGDLQ